MRLFAEVAERPHSADQRNRRQFLDQYLALHHGGKTTVGTYAMYADKERPFIGHVKVGALEADLVDSPYVRSETSAARRK